MAPIEGPNLKRSSRRWKKRKANGVSKEILPAPLEIPTLTEDDLFHFYEKHFPGALLPGQLCQGLYGEEYPYYEEEEDDGLGYYPDGNKRTLTDEQVAIFRHSEIERMVRDSETSPAAEEPTKDEELDVDEQPDAVQSDESDQMDMSEDDDQERIEAGSRPTESSPEPASTLTGDEKPRRIRRKWKERWTNNLKDAIEEDRILEKKDPLDYISDASEEFRTHRAKVREEDNIKAEVFELDY
ncbi:hypothetical protein EJ08DRAFT_674392 [Tothia fuscella]|uniref:Uncharacterized protein n=1 Tax=Tothia fuscella TaxID=1048955 RepID=A0A9P4P3D5_9PEZI|nr:hypothetical protein EJ08DRAFT_674392 [Tothia fuscella]